MKKINNTFALGGFLVIAIAIVASVHFLTTAKPGAQTNNSFASSAESIGVSAMKAQGASQLVNQNEVDSYVAAHPFPGGPTVNGKAPVVSFVMISNAMTIKKFLPAGFPFTFSGTRPVILVKETGPFVMSNIPIPPGESPSQYTYGYRIFDAQTGNLIMIAGAN